MDGAVILTEGMTPRIDTAKLVTVTEAAKLLKISRMAVYKAIQRGRLTIVKIGRFLFVNRSDLSKYHKTKSVGGRPKKTKP